MSNIAPLSAWISYNPGKPPSLTIWTALGPLTLTEAGNPNLWDALTKITESPEDFTSTRTHKPLPHSPLSPPPTLEEFLANGGSVTQIPPTKKRSTPSTITLKDLGL